MQENHTNAAGREADFSEFSNKIDAAVNGITLQPVDLSKEPLPIPKALLAGGVPLIAQGDVFTIVAQPGTGKSNLAEGLIAAYIVAKVGGDTDTLGFSYSKECVSIGKKVLWIDTERGENDILWTAKRLKQRCPGVQLSEYVDIYPCIKILDSNQLADMVRELCSSGKYDMVLVDGGLDLCPDLNNVEKATTTVKNLRAIAEENKMCVVVTLHPNKAKSNETDSSTGTGETIAGHLGSMLYRYSRAILYIKRVKGSTVRTLTSEAAQGKLSYSSETVKIYFDWNSEAAMFLSCDMPDTTKIPYNLDAAIEAFGGQRSILTSEFKKLYAEKAKVKEAVTKKHCAEMIKANVLLAGEGKTTNATYILNYKEEEEIPF